ncbi:hypothetical protein EmuJ_000047800 [Echinococcus multilocularis]|uniref:DUF5744 domain-containing protein n=1 Tax=Echinococcus multilocularis TaxID=6211 RepID=A0A087VX79_ECHMU|nr:hypothetical protein EmuJ_000047800 [Echinococcus multilocularis]
MPVAQPMDTSRPDSSNNGESKNQTAENDTTGANQALAMGPEDLIKFGQGVYSTTFRKRLHVTIPGQGNGGCAKAILLNTFFLEPFLYYLNEKKEPKLSSLWPSALSFPYMMFGDLSIHISRFVPLMKTTTTTAVVNDQVQFQVSPYMLICASNKNRHNSLIPCEMDQKIKNMEGITNGGWKVANSDLLQWPVVKTMGLGGTYTFKKHIPNPPFRYYYANTTALDPNVNHYLPHDTDERLYLEPFTNFAPPAQDDVFLALTMPDVGALGESSNKTNIYGNCLVELSLDVTFLTKPVGHEHLEKAIPLVKADLSSINQYPYSR